MAKRQQVQHKTQRDESSRLGELRETKQENRRLKRQLGRLQKQIIKLLEQRGQIEEEASATVAAPMPPPQDTTPGCPECGSDELKYVEAGPKTVVICADCKWRKTQR